MPDYRSEDVALHVANWVKKNRGTLVAVVGVLVIVTGVLIYGHVWRTGRVNEAARLYAGVPEAGQARMAALTRLVSGFGDTPVAVFAVLDLADEFYSQRQIARAEATYRRVLTEYSNSDICVERAKLGLGYCAQEAREYDKARQYYEEVKTGGGLYAAEAEGMLKLLEHPPVMPLSLRVPVEPSTVLPEAKSGEGDKGNGSSD